MVWRYCVCMLFNWVYGMKVLCLHALQLSLWYEGIVSACSLIESMVWRYCFCMLSNWKLPKIGQKPHPLLHSVATTSSSIPFLLQYSLIIYFSLCCYHLIIYSLCFYNLILYSLLLQPRPLFLSCYSTASSSISLSVVTTLSSIPCVSITSSSITLCCYNLILYSLWCYNLVG